MRKLLFTWILMLIAINASAQESITSLGRRPSSIYNHSSDTLELRSLPDSLLRGYHKIDSVTSEFNQQALTLKLSYDSTIEKINTSRDKINSSIDSLEDLRLPTEKYTNQIDSLNNLKNEIDSKFNTRLSDLKSKTTGKLNALDLPPQYREPVQSLTKNVDSFDLNSNSLSMPGLEMHGYELPKPHGLNIPNADFKEYANLAEVQTPLGDVKGMSENFEGIHEDVKNVTSGNLNDVQNAPKLIEQQAAKIEGVQELQKQSSIIDDHQGKLEVLKDPTKGKAKAAEMAKEAAIDHFAGKDQQLKSAMDQMIKYKTKYSSVSSIKELPKRPPNPMKGKPFVERVVPGLYFQYQQKGFNLFDFNPYAGYRLSGRFTTGVGWNQRYARDKKKDEWNQKAMIYGPRAYVDFRLFKSFIAHLEFEVMNSFVHTDIKNQNYQKGNREWVWGTMTGIKKDYKIYKNLRGTVLIQYNIFNAKFKAPYVDRFNSRIGVEYVLIKRKKS